MVGSYIFSFLGISEWEDRVYYYSGLLLFIGLQRRGEGWVDQLFWGWGEVLINLFVGRARNLCVLGGGGEGGFRYC